MKTNEVETKMVNEAISTEIPEELLETAHKKSLLLVVHRKCAGEDIVLTYDSDSGRGEAYFKEHFDKSGKLRRAGHWVTLPVSRDGETFTKAGPLFAHLQEKNGYVRGMIPGVKSSYVRKA